MPYNTLTSALPKKRYAQYWLQDMRVLDQILGAAYLEPGETVLEIGPGTGNLTERLLQCGTQVQAIEIDRTLEPSLQRRFKGQPFTVEFGDVLAMPLPTQPTVVVANIPYYITGPILDRLLGSPSHPHTQFRRVVLLVQREIGERLAALPSTPAYNALSVLIQYLADVEVVSIVPPQAFYPRPKVDSAVVALSPRSHPTPALDPRLFERLVKQGFSQRRKMLRNTLKSWQDTILTEQLLTSLGERPDSRAEMLSVTQWVNLTNQWGDTTVLPEIQNPQ